VAESVPVPANGVLPAAVAGQKGLVMELSVSHPLAQPRLKGKFTGAGTAARSQATRRIQVGGNWEEVPVYRVEEQKPGASAKGPAVLEEAFFTSRVDAGWQFEINDSGDILLTQV